MEQRRKESDRLKNYGFVALAALELLVSFTSLGYIHVPPITITFAYIPVLIAGCFLGVARSTALGCVFGLASMYKASAYYVMPFDQAFSPLLSASPAYSVLLSVGARTAFGLGVGVFFALARRSRHKCIWIAVISGLAPKMHSALVYGTMGLLFPELGYSLKNVLPIRINDVAVTLVCIALILLLWKISRIQAVRDVFAYIRQADSRLYGDKRSYLWGGLFMCCVLGAAVASMLYFDQRISYMLEVHGMHITANIEYDLLHLMIQFLIAGISLNFIMAIALLLMYRYLSYREYQGQIDETTGIMGRKMFLAACQRRQKSAIGRSAGWFIFVDIDYFKSINDTLGHPVGDVVLKKVAENLKHAFGEDGIVGRMGGDEFAVMLDQEVPLPELKRRLDRFLADVSDILQQPETVSCSIGACRFTYPQKMETLYAETDKILYAAKRQGRACYVIGAHDAAGVELIG